jgi:hypothetical protein
MSDYPKGWYRFGPNGGRFGPAPDRSSEPRPPISQLRMHRAIGALERLLNHMSVSYYGSGEDLPNYVSVHLTYGDGQTAMASVSLFDSDDEEGEDGTNAANE